MRYLSLADTERLDLRMSEVVPVVEHAFRLAAQGRAVVAPRLRLVHPPLSEGSLGDGRPWLRNVRLVPGGLEGIGFAVRVGAGLSDGGPSSLVARGVALLFFDWERMELRAVISDHLVHAVRSTAPNGVLAKHLALEDADTLGLIGSGRLARWAAEAVAAVRPLRRVRVWSPSPEHRLECVGYLRARGRAGLDVTAVASPEEAVRGAQVVVTATNARGPVLDGRWLEPGATVISNRPEELDRATLLRGRIVTTYREGVLGHVPPYRALLDLLASGELGPDAFATELADVIVGRAPGRARADEVIVCLNPAYGLLDAATADYVYREAVRAGVGLELGA